jgi:2-C-methyl-D-erythritol 2,4-cyclodiphosphate synthase
MTVRVGFGFDVHRLQEDRKLVLGGIEIPSLKGAIGHSDADVLIHAICDALLGAANLRDIGFHFPNSDEQYRNIDSKILLERACNLIYQKGFEIGNIDATVCLEAPKINPFIAQMQQVLAKTMNIQPEQVSIKATTNEKLGYVGREEGITAYAVCLISKN